MLENSQNFCKNFFDNDKCEDLEMDADSLYLAVSEENLKDVVFPAK